MKIYWGEYYKCNGEGTIYVMVSAKSIEEAVKLMKTEWEMFECGEHFNQKVTEIEGASYQGEAKVLKFVEFE